MALSPGQGADGAQLKGLDLVAGLGGIRIAGTAGIAGIIGTAGTAGGQTEHHSRGLTKANNFFFIWFSFSIKTKSDLYGAFSAPPPVRNTG